MTRTGRAYPAAFSHRLVPQVSHRDFMGGAVGSHVVLDGGTTVLSPVRCHVSAGNGSGLTPCDQEAMPIQRPLGMPDQGPGFRRTVAYPPLRVTRLRDAVCVPGGIVIHGDVVLGESFSAPWEMDRHRHMTRTGAGWTLDAHDVQPGSDHPTRDEPVLFLDHQHLDWYGHALLDLLGPAWAYAFCAAFLGLDRLRAICSRPTFDFVPRLIRAAGIPAARIDFIDRPVRCRELIVATKSFQIQEHVSPPSFRMWRAMRDRTVAGSPGSGRRIYVSRGFNPTRRLMEEDRIELVFRDHGFDIVHPERHALEEQMALFADASLIAGCSGSNMFNIAFGRNARAVLLLVSPLLVHYTEQLLISGAPGVRLDLVMGHVRDDEVAVRPGDVHAPWHLDPEAVRSLVAHWLRELGEPSRRRP